MPIYEYRCKQGHQFEVMQRIADDPVSTCTTCEAPVERVFHPVAVHFKGSGFYTTDYGKRKRGSESKDGAEGSTSEKSSSESSEKKTDSSKSDASSSPKSDKKAAA